MENQIIDNSTLQLLQREVNGLLEKVADDLGFDNVADLKKFISEQVDESRSAQIKRAESYLKHQKLQNNNGKVTVPHIDQNEINNRGETVLDDHLSNLSKMPLVNYSSDSDDNSYKSPATGSKVKIPNNNSVFTLGKRGLGSVTIVDYSSNSDSENEIPPSFDPKHRRKSLVEKCRRSSVGITNQNPDVKKQNAPEEQEDRSLSPISFLLNNSLPRDRSLCKKDNSRRKSRRSVCLPRAVVLSSDSEDDDADEHLFDSKHELISPQKSPLVDKSARIQQNAKAAVRESSDSEVEIPIKKVTKNRRALQSSDESDDDNEDNDTEQTMDNDDSPLLGNKSGTSIVCTPNKEDNRVIPETDSDEDSSEKGNASIVDGDEDQQSEESQSDADAETDENSMSESNEKSEDDSNFNDFMKTWRKSSKEESEDSETSDDNSEGMDDFIVNDNDSDTDESDLEDNAIGKQKTKATSGRFNYPSIPGTPTVFATPHFKGVRKTLNEKGLSTPRSAVKDVLEKVKPSAKAAFGTPAYKRHFLKQRETITRELFELYNKTVFDDKLPNDMKITYNKRMTKTAGFCYYTTYGPEKVKGSRIELSEKVVDSAERVRDTLIHEMCHAASWVINGTRDGHGPIWKRWANKANQIHPELPVVTRCHAYDIETKYKYKCNGCGHIYGRHSKSIDSSRHRCSKCGGTPELMNPTPKQTPSRYNMFVKENFSAVKKENPGVPHRDIMKIISQKFNDFKISSSNDKENVTPL